MKPKKISFEDTNLVNIGFKKIYEYKFGYKEMSVAKMVVKGRFPKDESKFYLEHKCSFIIIVIKNTGRILFKNETINLKEGDSIFVPAGNKYAIEGNFEYITAVSPAYYPEQAEEASV